MKKRLIILTLVLTIFLSTTISAGVYFSQPEESYNLGDIIKSNLTIEPIEQGFLTISLKCEQDSIQVSPTSNKDGKASIEFPLTTAWIENITGTCYFLAEYPNGINGKSRNFEISKKLDVTLSIDSLFAKPGEEITITGYAKRLNGANVNGEVEITIPLLRLLEKVIEKTNETNTTEENQTQENPEVEISNDNGIFYGQVKEGKFTVTFTLPNDISAGDYRIDALAFEKQDNERTSEGVATANLKIFQIPTSIEGALNNQNLNPGETLNFKPTLNDQTGMEISDEISVIITDEKSKRIFEKIISSGETIDYLIPKNLTSGYYEIKASSNELEVIKRFYVNEKAIASFKIENQTLIVLNEGNIPYKKDIQVELNGKPFVKSLDLKLGESHSFKLTGSETSYDIKISDGETEISQQGVALTGYAVGVKDLGKDSSISLKPIIWIFFIIILGAGVLFLLRNILKKKSFAHPFQRKSNSKIIRLPFKKETHEEVKSSKQTTPLVAPNQAEQVLVLNGEKTNAAVVVLKIKNKISPIAKQSLEKAIEPIYEKRGAVYEQGDYIFIIFSPLMTKTNKNEIIAAKAAEKIKIVLKEHNRRFKDQIEFGLSINSGEIINKIENKKLKFTALGKTITKAKRLAESSDEQILVTKESYERGISEIKVEKKKINNGEVYELRSVVDSEKNKKFINNFLDRMKKEEK